jgi:hypothetical protein
MKVFISHADQDEALASKIVSSLEDAGLEVWYDRREVLPGDNPGEKIGRGLSESDAMVVLVTPNALQQFSNIRSYIQYALTQLRFEGRLIPVLAGNAEEFRDWSMPWIFNHLPIISLEENGKTDEDLDRIAELLKKAA